MSNGNDHMDAATSSYERCNAGPSNDETYTTTSSRSPSELLSVAKRHYPRSSEDKIAEQAEILASKSDTEYGLAKISCEACYLRRSFDNSVRWFSVTSLSKDCDLCGILRKCQQHFANGCDAIELHARGSSNNLQICFPKSDCESNHVQLYCKESCMPQTPFRYAEDVHEFAESEASMSVMKKWISDCCTFHQHASPKRNSNPTRLIKLGRYEDDGARLYSPKHPVVFTALSYRWGLGKQSGTTKDNVTKRYQELNTSDFPKTLQDAIHITRRLGLEYIWIDRVCIIQDDKEDWANEASLMAGIYASAYVVLSATATEDCENGFLHKRQKPLLIRYAQHGQRSQKVYARRIESHLCHRMKPRTDYILHGRGWCMQERFLARRIIHFLPDEILFECQARRECECGAASNEDGDEFSQHGGSPEYGGYSNFARIQAAKSMEERELTINWARIVDRYSRMKLTYGKDSLPALSGIAACVQHLDPGKYIAGLWEKDIAIQLGWFIYPKDDLMRRWEDPKDINILGPTFSWSSHAISPVRYAYYHTARSFCALESFNIELATSNPYGQVRDATICLSGWSVSRYDMITLFRTPVVGFYDPCVYFDFGLQFEFDRHKKSLPRDKMIEELENTIGWESVMCFGLYEYHNPIMNTDQVDALLVQPSKTEVGKYVRIGVVLNLKKSWFKKTAVARTMNLV